MNKKVWIEVEPKTFMLGLGIWAILILNKFDIIEMFLATLSFLLYGYSISYGSKNYKEYCRKLKQNYR